MKLWKIMFDYIRKAVESQGLNTFNKCCTRWNPWVMGAFSYRITNGKLWWHCGLATFYYCILSSFRNTLFWKFFSLEYPVALTLETRIMGPWRVVRRLEIASETRELVTECPRPCMELLCMKMWWSPSGIADVEVPGAWDVYWRKLQWS